MESFLAVPTMMAPAKEVATACEACPADGAELAAEAQLEAKHLLQDSSKKPMPATATKAPVTMPPIAASKAHVAIVADIATAPSSPRHALLCRFFCAFIHGMHVLLQCHFPEKQTASNSDKHKPLSRTLFTLLRDL